MPRVAREAPLASRRARRCSSRRSCLTFRCSSLIRRTRSAAASAKGLRNGLMTRAHSGSGTGVGAGAADQQFQVVDEPSGGRHVRRAGPHERADEVATARRVRYPPVERRRQVGGMVVKRARTRAAARFGAVQQVMEMDRPFLAVAELGQQHRVHRPVEHRAFDHRARVQADHRVRVVERVEVVGLGPVIHGQAPARGQHTTFSRPASETRLPLFPALEVRPDQDAAIAQAPAGRWPARCRAQRIDEIGLGRAAFEQRRADVEHDRPVGLQADPGAECLARSWPASSRTTRRTPGRR